MAPAPMQPADADTDAMLKELKGTGAQLSQPDKTPAAAELDDPLEVKPAPTPSRTAQLDAKHSIRVGGKGYRVIVAGEYYIRSEDSEKKITKPYSLSFNLPYLNDPVSGAGALGIIVGKLLVPALQKTYPGALGYRTHELISAEPLTPDTPPTNSLQFMDRARLERYIQDHSVPIKIDDYEDTKHLRDAVLDHKLNPNGFEKREARRQLDRAQTKELLDMNPDLKEEAPVTDPEISTPREEKPKATTAKRKSTKA